MASDRQRKGYKRKNAQMYRQFFGDIPEDLLWNRKKNKGFISLPKTMPLVMALIDSLCPKGKPTSRTYFALWCRTWDGPMAEIKDERIAAMESGFSGPKATYTWRERMKWLVDKGFIIAKGTTGEYDFVLILNPHLVLRALREKGEISDDKLYNSLIQRAVEIGAGKEFEPAKSEPA